MISGEKTWSRGGNQNPPESIIVYVYADGELYEQRKVTAQDGWSYVFEGLPKFALDGHEIQYTIGEAPIRDYEMKVEGYHLVNTYVPGTNPEAPHSPGSPQSGDSEGSPGLWIGLAALALMSVLGIILLIRRRRKNH